MCVCVCVCDSLNMQDYLLYEKKGETIEENVGQKHLRGVAHVENKTIR